MNMNFLMKTRIVSGSPCVWEHRGLFADYGRRALIVTGAHGAKESGALDDVLAALRELGIDYQLFAEAEPNPQLAACVRGGAIAKSFYAQFVIGIGGGSALDTAKAVAVFAANDLQPMDLFSNRWSKPPLPVLAVGTTAGTGSEVNQYGVLTVPLLQTKKSFGNADTFPVIAFADPRYTHSCSRDLTVSCALDAFCHATESYFAKSASLLSRDMAVSAVRSVFPALKKLSRGETIDPEDRRELYYGSLYGGMAIAQTGTCFPHTLGYMPTYWHGVPHGRATAFFTGAFLRFCQTFDAAGISYLVALCDTGSLEGLLDILDILNPPQALLTPEEAEQFAAKSADAPSLQKTTLPYPANRLTELFARLGK